MCVCAETGTQQGRAHYQCNQFRLKKKQPGFSHSKIYKTERKTVKRSKPNVNICRLINKGFEVELKSKLTNLPFYCVVGGYGSG